jgi:Toprim-like/Protein of unknown function (DUF3991)
MVAFGLMFLFLFIVPRLGTRRGPPGSRKNMADAELESFKKDIDLRAYAASQGYELDRSKSWRGSAVMKNPGTGDKIIISREADGHHVYYSVRGDDRDNGSIIDFIQNRRKLTLGEVRKELRPWIGKPPVPVSDYAPLVKTTKDRIRVEVAFAKMHDAARHPYLEGERQIPAELLQSERFAGTVRVDGHGNSVFPHFDQNGLSGYEIKNKGFTGFATGGTKGLWSSCAMPDDDKLVVCESAIDAMSHAVLHPDAHARYASIGGKPSPVQPELVRTAVARLPLRSLVVAAMDADADGRKLAEMVRHAVELSGRVDLRFLIHEPVGCKDFNDELRGRALVGAVSRPGGPSLA